MEGNSEFPRFASPEAQKESKIIITLKPQHRIFLNRELNHVLSSKNNDIENAQKSGGLERLNELKKEKNDLSAIQTKVTSSENYQDLRAVLNREESRTLKGLSFRTESKKSGLAGNAEMAAITKTDIETAREIREMILEAERRAGITAPKVKNMSKISRGAKDIVRRFLNR